MEKKNWTPLFIAVIVLAIAVYDVWVIYVLGKPQSVSAHILSMGEKVPSVPALLGYSMGHLTWPMTQDLWDTLYRDRFNFLPPLFFLIVGFVGIYDALQFYVFDGDFIFKGEIPHFVAFMVSYTLGHFTWPMSPEHWSKRFERKD